MYIPRKKLIKRNRTYLIHDNGGRPFKVLINKNSIEIYTESSDYEDLILEIKDFQGYWSGYDSSKNKMNGNSLLVKISDYKYIFIGWVIYSFETNEKIKNYVSPIGNSDVPYPFAYTDKNVYFMAENKFVPIGYLSQKPTSKTNENIYRDFYSNNKKKIFKFKKLKQLVRRYGA